MKKGRREGEERKRRWERVSERGRKKKKGRGKRKERGIVERGERRGEERGGKRDREYFLKSTLLAFGSNVKLSQFPLISFKRV